MVGGLAPAALIRKRYRHINDFERLLADHGTRIVKLMLHVSKDYQLTRFKKRLTDPDTHWKFNPDDLAERNRWPAYMAAYETSLRRTSTEWAPWYCVPAEQRWWRNLVVTQILRRELEAMDPRTPPLKYDPALYTPESIS
jgi:polyphosphate kinase 2 (PPK2 family)